MEENDKFSVKPISLQKRPLERWFDSDIPGRTDLASIQETIIRQAAANINNWIEQETLKRIAELGYKFETKTEFYEFCKSRVTLCTFPDNRCEMYLDYGKPDQILITTFVDQLDVDVSAQDSKVTATWNRGMH